MCQGPRKSRLAPTPSTQGSKCILRRDTRVARKRAVAAGLFVPKPQRLLVPEHQKIRPRYRPKAAHNETQMPYASRSPPRPSSGATSSMEDLLPAGHRLVAFDVPVIVNPRFIEKLLGWSRAAVLQLFWVSESVDARGKRVYHTILPGSGYFIPLRLREPQAWFPRKYCQKPRSRQIMCNWRYGKCSRKQ